MQIPNAEPDVSMIEWLCAGAASVCVYLLGSNARTRKYIDERLDKMAAENGVDNAALWATINAEQQRAAEFRERIARDMVTKGDLGGVKQELLAAIYQQRPTPQPPRDRDG